MTISFIDGFDHYGEEAGKQSESLKSSKIVAGRDDPYGFEFADDEGNTFSVSVRRDGDSWRMTVKGEGEIVFSQRPTFMAYPA